MKVTTDNAYLTAINNASLLLLAGKSLMSVLDLSGLKRPAEVVGNYVDESSFTLALSENSGMFVILFVGFFIKEKDYDTLTATIRKFSELTTDQDFCFRIVGCGEEGKKKIVDDLQHGDVLNKVEIFPYVPREEIPEFHKSCNVFLSTSRLETFGIAMCETMMCGRPVVSTDNKGFDEMYVPGVNGIKCRVGDADQLAEALLSLQQKKIMFDPVAVRNSVLSKFGTEAFRKKLLAAYNEALNN
jgi:glycosyltransferase involved in cell wall biosynthesis